MLMGPRLFEAIAIITGAMRVAILLGKLMCHRFSSQKDLRVFGGAASVVGYVPVLAGLITEAIR
jgi:hypothetical protein